MKEFENTFPEFKQWHSKKYISSPDDANNRLVFVVFDTETSCSGKQAEIIQLAAESEGGQTFNSFTILMRGNSPYVKRINKFEVSWASGEKVLHRGGIAVQTVSVNQCLQLFADFLGALESLRKKYSHWS